MGLQHFFIVICQVEFVEKKKQSKELVIQNLYFLT